jgi:hypothetical protein
VTGVIFVAGNEIRFTENIGITIISVEYPVIFQRKVSEKFFRCKKMIGACAEN